MKKQLSGQVQNQLPTLNPCSENPMVKQKNNEDGGVVAVYPTNDTPTNWSNPSSQKQQKQRQSENSADAKDRERKKFVTKSYVIPFNITNYIFCNLHLVILLFLP